MSSSEKKVKKNMYNISSTKLKFSNHFCFPLCNAHNVLYSCNSSCPGCSHSGMWVRMIAPQDTTIARSRKDLSAHNLAPQTIPSLPLINTTPTFHQPLLSSSPCIRTMSPCSMDGPPLLWLRLCLSLKLLMYSLVYWDHSTPLQCHRYLACFL